MKVMNVGNANYANSRQQNFGMDLHLDESVIKLIGEQVYIPLLHGVETLCTNKGRDLLVTGTATPDGKINLSAINVMIGDDLTQMKAVVSMNDDQTFYSSFSTIGERLKFALERINKCFD